MTTLGLAGGRKPFNVPFAFFAGVLTALTEALLHPIVILVFFVSQLTDSLDAVALVVAVGLLGRALPQFFVPWLTNAATRQMPWALGASVVRAAAVALLAYVANRGGISDNERLRAFFICYIAYSVASGFAQAPVNELLARSLPGDRRALVIRQRNLWGGLLAIGAGLVARQTLGPDGPAFPRNATLLFIAATAAVAGATFFIGRIGEPPSIQRTGAGGTVPNAADFVRVLGDGAYRRFALVGIIAAAGMLAEPFYVVFAQREFGLPSDMVGTFLALFAAGVVLSTPLWALIARIGGARGTIQAAFAIRVIAPVVALILPYAVDSELYRNHITNARVPFYALAVPFAAFGVAARGLVQGNFRYVMEMAVPERRAAYQMLALVPMLVAAAAPFAGAEIAARWGFDRLFLIAVFAGFVAILASGLLASTSMRVRTVSRAWRLRDARP